MNLLVTGGSGFIGTRLVTELLAGGHRIAIFDLAASAKHPALCVHGDVRDRAALTAAAAGHDAIIHLAAEHRDEITSPQLYAAVNAVGAENVVAAARAASCGRIVFVSSVAVYPLGLASASEEVSPRPYNPYGESKLAAEQIFQNWANSTPKAVLALVRACVVFGEGNRGNVYNLLRQIHRRRFVMIGDGRNRKSMAYVGNLTRFLAKCLEFPPGVHLYNYADKPDFSTRELVALANRALGRNGLATRVFLPRWAGLVGGWGFDVVARLTGRRFPFSASRVRKFCAETTVCTRRLESSGFLQTYGLEEALVRTIRFEFDER